MIVNILVLASDNFNKTIKEIEKKLEFNLTTYNFNNLSLKNYQNCKIVIIDSEFLLNNKNNLINFKNFKLPILLISNLNYPNIKNFFYNDVINFPISIFDLKKKIVDLIASYKFSINSSIYIKNYLIDKNLKIMKNEKVSINLTEKEINLLELLNEEKKLFNKITILKKVWKYSTKADTHTVETHIYRLRKKVLDAFKDKNFINIHKGGYSL